MVDQTKRTGRGTKDSPLTDVQIQDLAGQGIREGDTVAGKGVLRPGGFFDTPSTTPQSGIVTSDSASSAVDSARSTLNDIGSSTGATSKRSATQDQLSILFQQLSDTRGKLTQAKERERLAEENLTDVELQSKLSKLGRSEEATGDDADLAGGVNAINRAGEGGEVDTSIIDDPVLRGITDATINTVTSIQAQVTRLDDYRKTMSEFSQAEVDDISATALRSVERQIAENARVKRSLEFAGIIGGRAQFAPTTEGTLIHEIVQDGLDRIDVIEDKKNVAIRQARQAETEFDYALFTDSVNLAKDLHKEIEDGITDLKAEVRQAEKDEQNKITFRQQQEDRNAILLAPEIFEETKDMTPEEQQAFISKVSVANDIPLGSLLREVRDYTPEPEKVAGGAKGAIIGSFSQSQSDRLRANGLENASIQDQRLFLEGSVSDRTDVLKRAGETAEPATIDDVSTLIAEQLTLTTPFGAFGGELQTELQTQAVNFGVASKIRGSQGDVRALLKHPAIKPAVEAELAAGTSKEDILTMLANDALMSQLLAEHKAK